MKPSDTEKSTNQNKRLLIKLSVGVLFMFGFAYMLVPLYSLVCSQLGINGKSVNQAIPLPSGMKEDTSRIVEVDFTTTIHGKLPFTFKPLSRHIKIHPGKTELIYFYAKNKSKQGMTVQAIPSITPSEAAKYLKKTQCFCFTQQYFFEGEKADMPVYFYVDPKLPKDIKEITLSYTLFDATRYKKKGPHFNKGRIDL